MAKILFQPDNVVHEFEDGSALIDICDEVDITLSFGCTEGTCGVCELTVVKGMENISKVTDEEKEYLLPEDINNGMRLGCQIKIKRGEVAITWKGNRAK
ncbi:MAG: 2Fe-2S iron-sulfur cluster-binding protein [Nitrospinales bacterium]